MIQPMKPYSRLERLQIALGCLIFGVQGFPVPSRPLDMNKDMYLDSKSRERT